MLSAMPTPHVETEFKLRLDNEEGFQRLLRELEALDVEPAVQTNHFFDTSARPLRDGLMALRLREERGTFTITLKGGAKREEGSALTTRGEVETLVDGAVAKSVLAGERSPLALLAGIHSGAETPLVAAALACVGTGDLVHLGSFTNERRSVGPVPLGDAPPVVLELDRVLFPGAPPQFELEAEIDAQHAEAVERGLRELFTRVGLPWETAPSKAARFFALQERPAP